MHGIMAAQSASTSGNTPQPRLVKAAREFEAQMMKELLKPMTTSGLSDEDDAGSSGAMVGFASEALGRAVSAQGGFGIADRILADLSRSGTAPTTTKVIGNLRSDNAMSSNE